MNGDSGHILRRSPRTDALRRVLAWALGVAALCAAGLAQPPAPAPAPAPASQPAPAAAIPPGRVAQNVVVIPIQGEIDRWTTRSVIRRIHDAEASRADAIVFELDTPGGEMTSMLLISGAIKASSVRNTVAWVNRDAYSAGCVIALACREIVHADAAAVGDALPIQFDLFFGVQKLADAEREKLLGPVMADVIDSARRNGYDEMLVQAFVRRGVELWLVEHAETGERLFVTEEQHRLAVGSAPSRGTPAFKSITGPVDPTGVRPPAHRRGPRGAGPGPAAGPARPTDMIPASPTISGGLREDVSDHLGVLGTATSRPDLTAPAHAGRYRVVGYVSDGSGVLTLRDKEIEAYGLGAGVVNAEADLRAFFGARNVVRVREAWYENLARVLSFLPVKALLIIVFLIAVFVEMSHPGLVLPGTVAGLCLVALLFPPVLVNVAAWWMVGAIVAGVLCIGLELFVTPGMGAFGIVGVVLLFGGLVGAVVGGPQNLFPGAGDEGGGVLVGLTTVLLSLLVAGGAIFFISRNMTRLPIFGRMVLTSEPAEDAPGPAAEAEEGVPVAPGAVGVALTPLRPAGRAQFGDAIVDVVADGGFVDAGAAVRVLSAGRFRISVEAAGGQ